jgi:vitamin B12 transporter
VRDGENDTMQLHSLSLAIALGLPMLGLSPVAAAQSGETATDLDSIVVTATRTARTIDAALAAVEVIDRAQIERSQARSLPELLRGRAGINLVNQGGAGKLTTLFLRGTESDHVLFLIDGVRVGSATSGLTALQDLPVDVIERIEIVRGPRSSLYGADAIGGVIQVFTRREQPGTTPQFRLGAGSHDLREASAGLGIGGARGWFGVDASYQRTDGINACDGSSIVFAGCFAEEPDRDGYRNRSVSLRGGFRPTDAWSLDAHALRAEGRNEYDSYADAFFQLPNVADTVQQVIGGKLRYAPSARIDLQLSAGRNLDDSVDSRDGVLLSRFLSTRDSATLQGDFGIQAGQLLTLGLDWLRDEVASDTPFDATRRGNRAAFAQYQGRIKAHDLQASVRRDDNDQFGTHDTGSLAWGVALGHALRFTTSFGTAFKAPTFNELYYPFFGNPDLRPEASDSVELGLGQRRDAWHWQLNAFQTRIDDLITYDAALGLPNNLDRARIRGAELSAGTRLAGWELAAQASHVDPRNRSNGANFDKQLPRRAHDTARLDLDRAFGTWRIGTSWIAESARYDDVANTRRLDGYATVDLRIEYALHPDWTVQARASNLLDRDYETAAYYNQPGREFGLSVRWRPME